MIIPLVEIVRSVTTENPWWSTGNIPQRYAAMERRAYFEPFQKLASSWDVNRAVILLGPRRVGKTVMTQHLIQKLIDDGVNPKSIFYVSIDTPTYTNQSLQFFVDLHADRFDLKDDDQRYIVFDEIQYLSQWERHLKVLVDKCPNIKFIASGSAAAALKLASVESGAGRFTEFMLPPLTFEEYLIFVGKGGLVTNVEDIKYPDFPTCTNISELNAEFVNYVNYGGYPEAVFSEAIRMDAARYIKSDIIEKVLLRDLPQLYGITNIQELNNLFTALAYQTGQEISLETLSQNSGGISKPTITRYIEYLEAAFLIFRLKRVDNNARVFARERTFKIYLTNPSMRAALFSPLAADSEGFGHLVETAILSQWLHSHMETPIYYARWKRAGRAKSDFGDHAEIDAVHMEGGIQPTWLAEIKWSDRAVGRAESWHAIREFVKMKPTVKSGVFTTISTVDKKSIDGINISILPSALYCYTIGRNTVRHRGRMLASLASEELLAFKA